MTELLFGDDLQTQLTHIRAANKISNTVRKNVQVTATTQSTTILFFKLSDVDTKPAELQLRQQSEELPSELQPHETCRTNKEINDAIPTLMVSDFNSALPQYVGYCRFKANTFRAGQILDKLDHWKTLTSDQEILDTITGQAIDFLSEPIQINPPYQPKCSDEQAKFIDSEILVLEGKGIIERTVREQNNFIFTIFLHPKKDGPYRMILNLKSLNQFVEYHHFKIDTIASAIEMVTPGCFMASIDLKDAYYSVSIANQDRKYLKFSWRNNLYQFTCFPNGLAVPEKVYKAS